jgi:hypothetical protein
MYTKIKDIPELAQAYKVQLAGRVGLCMEVCITAFAVYAQIVEGLSCVDSLYYPDHDAIKFFEKHGHKYNGKKQNG